MPGMEMPGGWTMSMAWMRMPGQSWFGAASTFLGMWVVMMVAMMLPSLVPMLMRYRAAVAESRSRSRLTVLVAAGYFFVWTLAGVAAYPLGLALAAAEMRFPAVVESRSIRRGADRRDRGRSAIHRLEAAPARVLPGCAPRALSADCGHRLAPRAAARPCTASTAARD